MMAVQRAPSYEVKKAGYRIAGQAGPFKIQLKLRKLLSLQSHAVESISVIR
jgi:hypothetical protein